MSAPDGLRVLTWNVYHCRDGRGVPGPTPASTWRGAPVEADGYVHLNRTLVGPVAALIRRARPDVCLLQEVPPLVVPALARGAGMRAGWAVLTSPLVGPVWVRGRLGLRNPDLWRTHAGNANVVLVGPRVRPVTGSAGSARLNPWRRVLAHAAGGAIPPAVALNWMLEARRALAAGVVLPGGAGATVVCAHLAGPRSDVQTRTEMAALVRALGGLDGPVILGGDLNVHPDHPALAGLAGLGFTDGGTAPGIGIDRILVRGLPVLSPPRRWDPSDRDVPVRGPGGVRLVRLSDHDPVEAVVGTAPATGSGRRAAAPPGR